MKSKIVAAAVLMIFFSSPMMGQKVKYKDLFPILDAKNYEEGGPLLFTYLSDPKNADEANPNLQLGFLLESRFLGLDVVSDSLRVFEVGDSSIFFLNKAKTLIDEKELKKRDEYYQAFFRRDLRTGEFGIKVSDVHLDIEKKVEAIESRMEDVRNLNTSLSGMNAAQKRAALSYQKIAEEFGQYNTLLVAATEDDQKLLRGIEDAGKLAVENAERLQSLASKLGTSSYSEGLELKEINSFGVDGMTRLVSSDGKIRLWDYESWARGVNSEIRGSIGLFKTLVNKYATDIREKKKLIKRSQDTEIDSMSVQLSEQFAKYDPNSTAQKLLTVEMLEARIMKQVDLQLNPALLDSSLIGAQLQIFENAYRDASRMKKLVNSISADDLTLMKKKYREYNDSFFQAYVTASKYVSEMKEWVSRNENWLGAAVDFWQERNKWGIVVDENNLESQYPLFIQDAPEQGLMTLGVPIKNAEEAVIYGVNFTDGVGYVKGFGQDRYEKWKQAFPIPVEGAAKLAYDTIPTINGSIGFYVYNSLKTENNFTVVSFTPEGQLNWATQVTLSKDPVDFKFDDLTQELTILMYPEEQLPLDSDELGYVVIDRTGNAR